MACCADAVSQARRLGDTPQLLFFNRKRLFRNAKLNNREGDELFSTDVGAFSESQLEEKLQKQVLRRKGERSLIVVSTPPPQTNGVCDRLLKLLRNTNHPAEIDVWVVSNGCLSPEISEGLASLSKSLGASGPQLNFTRGLLLAGFESSHSGETLVVTHTSGRQIYYGPHFPSLPFSGEDLFRLKEVNHIRQLELRKAFVNAALGWVIGPRQLSNAHFATLCPESKCLLLAKDFLQALPEAGSAQELVEFLQQTITETSHNVNSVSLAWSRGNPSLALYFRNLLGSAPKGSSKQANAWWPWFCAHKLSE